MSTLKFHRATPWRWLTAKSERVPGAVYEVGPNPDRLSYGTDTAWRASSIGGAYHACRTRAEAITWCNVEDAIAARHLERIAGVH